MQRLAKELHINKKYLIAVVIALVALVLALGYGAKVYLDKRSAAARKQHACEQTSSQRKEAVNECNYVDCNGFF